MRKLAWFILLSSLLVSACHRAIHVGTEIQGSGKRTTQKRDIGAFKTIETEGAFTIEVTCQKDPSLELEADDNVIEFITAEVRNEVLHLRSTKSYSASEPVKFTISVPNLEAVSVSGAGKIDIKGMNNDSFEIDSKGAPTITVAGRTKVVNIDTNGAGKIDTHKLRASRAVVDSNGVSNVDIDVSEQLDVTVSGPSTITYRGDPVVNKSVNGQGSVEKRVSGGA
ncbi:MAG TPA: head GIN domain-containing protein [Pyrinomonadaceae bacterium]|nr:head GIN domain-containing protein [Pyrinomonadaceae bacterium]